MRRLLLPAFVLLAVGGLLDFGAHALGGAWPWQERVESTAHLTVFAGMALCLLGLPRRRRQGESNAVR